MIAVAWLGPSGAPIGLGLVIAALALAPPAVWWARHTDRNKETP